MGVVTLLMFRVGREPYENRERAAEEKCPKSGESKIKAPGTFVPVGHCLHIGFSGTRNRVAVPVKGKKLSRISNQRVPSPTAFAQVRWS
jgi:hypothetical protein